MRTTQTHRSSRAQTIKEIRATLGRTQAELATALGISSKAVQSYEQGWRMVPVRVMIQLLVLLAIHRRHPLKDQPCWTIRRCPPEVREQCPSHAMGDGHFCWFVGPTKCRPSPDEPGILACMHCPVIQRLLKPAHT